MESLARSERVRNSSEFQSVYRLGRKIVTEYFVLFYAENDEITQLGITVTRAVGKAHERNRIKRQVREYFRRNKGSLPKGAYVVKSRSGAAEAENKSLREDLKKGFRRLKTCMEKISEKNNQNTD